ncbi:MAG: HAD family hydrolase [Thermoplasmata archaeon]
MSKKILGIIFDLDGTLLNTLSDIALSMNSVLSEFGFPGHPVESYRYFIGDGIEELCRRVLPEEKRSEDKGIIKLLVGKMKDVYSSSWRNNTAPYPGIEDMLLTFAKLEIPMSIVSNKPQQFAEEMVKEYFKTIPFRAVFGNASGRPKKPDPASAFESAEKMGLSPSSIAFAGDSATDILTAKNAGMISIGVLWGFRSQEELKDAGADLIVETPAGITDLVLLHNE